jgi:hypothetical protein
MTFPVATFRLPGYKRPLRLTLRREKQSWEEVGRIPQFMPARYFEKSISPSRWRRGLQQCVVRADGCYSASFVGYRSEAHQIRHRG